MVLDDDMNNSVYQCITETHLFQDYGDVTLSSMQKPRRLMVFFNPSSGKRCAIKETKSNSMFLKYLLLIPNMINPNLRTQWFHYFPSGDASDLFKKNAEPIFHLAGVDVTTVKVHETLS